jgi:hypothetical protein
MAYIGVGEHTMCKECGVDVRNRYLHDNFHAELEKLRRENLELSAKVEKLERDIRTHDLIGV